MAFAAAAALVIAIAATGPFHRVVARLIAAVAGLMAAHPVAGAIAFAGLAGFSAMVAFFSSAALVPTAIEAWGASVSFALLWLGWIGGGAVAYGLARLLGRPAIRWAVSEKSLGRFEAVVSAQSSFGLVFLVQLAVPSELPGYLFGLARLPFTRFLAALALAELPYAAATVYAGSAFLDRRLAPLAIGMAVAGGLGAIAYKTLRHRIDPGHGWRLSSGVGRGN